MSKKAGKTSVTMAACMLLVSQTTFAVDESATISTQSRIASYFAAWKPTWVATLAAGPAWENGGGNQTITLAPGIVKTYTKNNTSSSLADVSLFLGVQQPAWKNLQAQYGLDIANNGNAYITGDIWDDASPVFNNYTYKYQINHTHLNVKAVLQADMGYLVIPWISASAGVAFNDAHDFSNAPGIFTAVPSPNFRSNTITSFNYTFGIGMQRPVNQHWQAGISYQFANWGNSELDTAQGQTTGNRLSLSNLYTNSILANISYQS